MMNQETNNDCLPEFPDGCELDEHGHCVNCCECKECVAELDDAACCEEEAQKDVIERIEELDEINEKLRARIAELENMMKDMVPMSCMWCDRTWGVNEDGYCEKCAEE